jgi:hypothetical protein
MTTRFVRADSWRALFVVLVLRSCGVQPVMCVAGTCSLCFYFSFYFCVVFPLVQKLAGLPEEVRVGEVTLYVPERLNG